MLLRLRLDVEGRYFNGGAVVEVPELMREEFEPLRTCDDPVTARITGDVVAKTAAVKIAIKKRKDSAEILAKELAEMILNEMRKDDEHNGYRKRRKQ